MMHVVVCCFACDGHLQGVPYHLKFGRTSPAVASAAGTKHISVMPTHREEACFDELADLTLGIS